jgi:hypothetical protein
VAFADDFAAGGKMVKISAARRLSSENWFFD